MVLVVPLFSTQH